ncbi:hypothetical protein MJO29_001940, partial [Puccinia striiformis f. sp. tritici]
MGSNVWLGYLNYQSYSGIASSNIRLKSISKFQAFSAGLVIGGKSLEDKRLSMKPIELWICASHILSMRPFRFSPTDDTTQTKPVKDLRRLSLTGDPEYVLARERRVKRDLTTPKERVQSYMVTPLDCSINFKHPASLLSRPDKLKQQEDVISFLTFLITFISGNPPRSDLLTPKAGDTVTCMESKSKSNGLEFTNIAARGLDFPSVDWVVQLNCPEDVDTYIHPVGRSARYQSGGKVLLLLSPSEEEGMLKKWETRGIVVTKVKPNESKKQTIQTEIQAPMFQFPELKFFGQGAFISRWPERSIRARSLTIWSKKHVQVSVSVGKKNAKKSTHINDHLACIAECFLYIGRGNHSTSTQGSAIPVEVIPVISGMMSTIVDNIDHTGYLNIGDSILLAAISREILTIKPLDGSEKGFNLSVGRHLFFPPGNGSRVSQNPHPIPRSWRLCSHGKQDLLRLRYPDQLLGLSHYKPTSYLKAQNPEIGCCRSHIRRTWAILGNGNMTEALNCGHKIPFSL